MSITKQVFENITAAADKTIRVTHTTNYYEDGEAQARKVEFVDYPEGTPISELPAGNIRAIANLIWHG